MKKNYRLRMLPPPERDPDDPDEPRETPPDDPREGEDDVVLGADRVTDPLDERPDEDDLDGAVNDRKTRSRTELGFVTRLPSAELARPTSLEG